MKKVFFIMHVVFNLVAICHTIGQENIYFNKRYFNNGIIGVLQSIELNGFYFNFCYKNKLNGNSELHFLRVNNLGDTVNSKTIITGDSISAVGPIVNSICKLNQEIYFGCSIKIINEFFNNEQVTSGCIVKMKNNTEISFIKKIDFQNAYRSGIFSIYADSIENKLYCLGAKVIQTNDSTLNYRDVKTVFACLDTLGNIIWEREYGEYGYIPTVGLIKNKYGGFYIHGSVSNAALSNSKNEANIIKIDTQGNIIWQRRWLTEANTNQSIAYIETLENGDAIVTSPVYSDNFETGWSYLGYVNSEGMMYYFRSMFNRQGVILSTQVFKHKNHYLNLVHYKATPTSPRSICLYEFNENLDSLGCTFFDFQGRQHLYDMKQLPDGGFLFGGFMKDENNMNQAAWLMRIDSNLCANPMCTPVGIEEMLSEFKSENEILVYPNPAQNEITIDHKNYDITKIEIYNSLGNLVHEQGNVTPPATKLSLENFASGIYIIRSIDKNQVYYTHKIIKQ